MKLTVKAFSPAASASLKVAENVVRFAPKFSNQPESIGYSTFCSQVIRFVRICNNLEGAKLRILYIYNLYVYLGFSKERLIKRYHKVVNKHNLANIIEGIGNIL